MNDWVVTIGDSKFTGLAALIMFLFLIGVYLLPAILAMANRKVHKVTIGLIEPLSGLDRYCLDCVSCVVLGR